jgi:hypothetical protein
MSIKKLVPYFCILCEGYYVIIWLIVRICVIKKDSKLIYSELFILKRKSMENCTAWILSTSTKTRRLCTVIPFVLLVRLFLLFLNFHVVEKKNDLSFFWYQIYPEQHYFHNVIALGFIVWQLCTFSRRSCKQCELFPLHVNQKTSSIFLYIVGILSSVVGDFPVLHFLPVLYSIFLNLNL